MHEDYFPEFLTSTIFKFKHLLADDHYKRIITDSLDWLVTQKRCEVNGFVIMPNHIHLLWQIANDFDRSEVQGALFSFTAHQFQKELRSRNPGFYQEFFVDLDDRKYQFWHDMPVIKQCWSDGFFSQKLDYIHDNPCQPKWNLAKTPEEYYWSSAAFYENGSKTFPWLTHYEG